MIPQDAATDYVISFNRCACSEFIQEVHADVRTYNPGLFVKEGFFGSLEVIPQDAVTDYVMPFNMCACSELIQEVYAEVRNFECSWAREPCTPICMSL